MIVDFFARFASGLAGRGKLAILTYHRVLSEPDPFFDDITADMFRIHATALSKTFNVLRLDEAVRMMRSNILPSRAVVITFDDGYADNFEIALPILVELGIPATIFIATGFIDQGIMWNDVIRCACKNADDGRIRDYAERNGLQQPLSRIASLRLAIMRRELSKLKYLPLEERRREADEFASRLGQSESDNLMMTWNQVAELPPLNIEVGAHTVNHPILTSASPSQAWYEISESRRVLQEATKQEITSFAYPNGNPLTDYDQTHIRLLQESGFNAAVSTRVACARHKDNLFELPRLGLWDRSVTRTTFRLIDFFLRK